MLTDYQKRIIASLYHRAVKTKEMIENELNVDLSEDVKEIGEAIELRFRIEDFSNQWEHLLIIERDKNEKPFVEKSPEKEKIMHSLISYGKIWAKKIERTENPYHDCFILYNDVHNLLPEQFGFTNGTKSSVDAPSYLNANGLKLVTIDKEKVWVYPKNYNEKEGVAVSSIFETEAEGLLEVGGKPLLDEKIKKTKLSMWELLK